MRRVLPILFLLFPIVLSAQTRKPAKLKPAASKGAVPKPAATTAAIPSIPYIPLQLIGIRPGISMDSIRTVLKEAGATVREVNQDTLTHCFADQSIHIYVVDSIMIRLTYMRLSFLVDGSTNRLRRFTITPRESSVSEGRDDDLEAVLLLYFGQTYGKPVMDLDPPLPHIRWRIGNIEVRSFIKRGYPVWVMEG